MKIIWVIIPIFFSSQLHAKNAPPQHRFLRIENTDSNDEDTDLLLPSPHKGKLLAFDLDDRSNDRESGVFPMETLEDDEMDEAIENDDADIFYDVNETIDSEESQDADIFLEADDVEEEPRSSPIESSMPAPPVASSSPACSLFGWRKAKEYFTKKSLEFVTSGIILDNIETIEWVKQDIEYRLNDPIFQKKIIQQLIRAGMGAIALACEKTGMMPPGTFQSVWSQITEARNMVNHLDGI